MDGEEEPGAVLSFTRRLDGRAAQPPTDAAEEEIAQGDAYATVKGQRVALYLEFIPRQGDGFVIAYAHLPTLWIRRPSILLVEYPSLFTVRLRCKALPVFRRLFTEQRLVWLRECDEDEAALLPAAVTGIDILPSFPSHEVHLPATAAREAEHGF